MSTTEEMNKRFNKVRKNLWKNLAVNWFIPLVLVVLVRSIYPNDTMALAIAGVIPVVRTAVILIWRRRVDWIGVLGILGFGMALIVSVFSGGSSLPLKLYHPVVTGIIGLIFLCSVVIRKPLLIIILRVLKRNEIEGFNSPESRKKFTFITALLGFILLIEAIIHVIMAFTLSTVVYLSMSRVVTWVSILVVVVSGKLIARRNK